jgi:two-component SAPR family response regulator
MRMEKKRSNPQLIISNIPIYRKNNIDFKEIISNIDKKQPEL